MISPDNNPGQHLRILAHIAGQLESDEFMVDWLAAEDDQEIKEALLRNERYISLIVDRDLATSEFIGKQVGELALPAGTLIAIVRRGRHSIVPGGSTRLKQGDRLTIIGEPKVIETLYAKFHDQQEAI